MLSAQSVTGFVLAGGRSSRLGQDKVLLPWNNSTLLEEALRKLCLVVGAEHGRVRICTNRLELGRYAPVVPDAQSDRAESAGPLAGILAALEVAETDWNLFLPVDLPLLPVEFLSGLLAYARASQALAVIPYLANHPQPLCAAYHRKLLPGLQQAFLDGRYKVMLAMQEATAQTANTIPENSALARYDVNPTHADWFLNINTPEELAQARTKFLHASGIFNTE